MRVGWEQVVKSTIVAYIVCIFFLSCVRCERGLFDMAHLFGRNLRVRGLPPCRRRVWRMLHIHSEENARSWEGGGGQAGVGACCPCTHSVFRSVKFVLWSGCVLYGTKARETASDNEGEG